jgi:hypothetical protein
MFLPPAALWYCCYKSSNVFAFQHNPSGEDFS